TVEPLAAVGRGSPTGVICYRHTQFPEYYQGGLFMLDWTFGRLYFVPIEPAGGTYRGAPEIFMESVGTEGFAPTALAVGFDGSLYVSTGGRSTPGAVYRIQYAADPGRQTLAASWRLTAGSPITLVISAPQPLAAWSRAVWRPEAALLAPATLETVAADSQVPAEQRIRAIEVLTEVHSGLSPAGALACAQSASPQVRARVAWAIGIKPVENAGPVLLGLTRDTAPEVRAAALETMRQLQSPLDIVTRQQALSANLGHADKRVRQAAARLASGLPEVAWNALWKQQEATGVSQSRLTTVLALLWRDGISQVHTTAVNTALSILNQTRAPEFREQALRLIFLGLGDAHLDKPSIELYTAYESALPLADHTALTSRLGKALVALLPSGDGYVDAEAARLLAVIESADPAAPRRLLANCTARSEGAADFHYLTAFSRLRASSVTNFTTNVAQVLIGMDRKLDPSGTLPRQNWTDRLVELTQALLRHDPRLADALLRQPDFGRPAHLALVPLLGSDRYTACARVFNGAINRTKTFPWSEALIDLLSALPPEETHALFRRQLSNVSIRDRLILELAPKAQPADREYYIAGLGSPRTEVVRASMTALLQLPNDAGTTTSAAVLRALRRLLNQPKEQTARAQAVALLGRLVGQKFNVEEHSSDLGRVYQPIFSWFETKYPGLSRQLDADDNETPAQWETRLQTVPWNRGDPGRGQELYVTRGCQNCHDGAQALGPDLTGAAQRYSAPDLLRAVIFPSREIAPPYRMTTFRLRDRQSYTGLVAFESADGVILRTGLSSTVRLAAADIVGREASTVSFMPSGLLGGLNAQDLADLHAYLKTLQRPQ
ncbi:MAG TPA: HEAT repeat domain-containing protein, partial [Verrucomicrobiae bacterium]|nr:HEAT repeat domain-containing protein [Verrucomicrobiae bacterium]